MDHPIVHEQHLNVVLLMHGLWILPLTAGRATPGGILQPRREPFCCQDAHAPRGRRAGPISHTVAQCLKAPPHKVRAMIWAGVRQVYPENHGSA